MQTQLGQARTQFGLQEPLAQPTRLEYGAGFGEAFPMMPRAEREPVLNSLMPSMPGMPTTGSVEFHEPPGYGFYQDGAELPWSDLVTPPQNSFLTQTAMPSPSGAVSTEPLAWFSQGYEPAWDATLNFTGYLGTGGYAEQDQHDEYGDAYDRVWATASYLSSASYNDLNYELLSPVTVLKRGLSQWGWETQQLTPGTQQWWFSPVSVYGGTAYAAAAQAVIDAADDTTNDITD